MSRAKPFLLHCPSHSLRMAFSRSIPCSCSSYQVACAVLLCQLRQRSQPSLAPLRRLRPRQIHARQCVRVCASTSSRITCRATKQGLNFTCPVSIPFPPLFLRHTRSSCYNCELGKYQPDYRRTSCALAPTGRYTDQTGQSGTKPCSPGSYQDQQGKVGGCPACRH